MCGNLSPYVTEFCSIYIPLLQLFDHQIITKEREATLLPSNSFGSLNPTPLQTDPTARSLSLQSASIKMLQYNRAAKVRYIRRLFVRFLNCVVPQQFAKGTIRCSLVGGNLGFKFQMPNATDATHRDSSSKKPETRLD